MKKIKYINRKRALGDVLWIEPIIRAYSSIYDKVIVHTKYNMLFENYPNKNVVFKNKLNFFEKVIVRLEKALHVSWFSLNLDGAYEKSPQLHFLHAYQKKASLPFCEEYPNLYLSEQEKNQRLLQKKYVVLHLESFSDKKYRQIYGVEWEKIVEMLQEMGLTVIQIGVTSKSINGARSLKTSIRDLMSLIYNSELFIGIDSGPSHIASALGTPAIILFGAINPNLRHFDAKFNGYLLKNPCNTECIHVQSKERGEFECKTPLNDDIPKCCIFNTETIISIIKQLSTKNAVKNN